MRLNHFALQDLLPVDFTSILYSLKITIYVKGAHSIKGLLKKHFLCILSEAEPQKYPELLFFL